MKPLLFDKRNYLVLAFAILVVIVGFLLMSGGKSTDGVSFNPKIFSVRRIVVAPLVCLAGFILFAVGIMLPPQRATDEKDEETKLEN